MNRAELERHIMQQENPWAKGVPHLIVIRGNISKRNCVCDHIDIEKHPVSENLQDKSVYLPY